MHSEEPGFRSFGGINDHFNSELSENLNENQNNIQNSQNIKEFISLLNEDIIGNYQAIDGPFGQRPLLYCDWTASGRALNRFEDFIRSKVLPFYGNTVNVLYSYFC